MYEVNCVTQLNIRFAYNEGGGRILLEEFQMKLKVDVAFKEMMENKDARKGFLAAVLKLDLDDIRETRIMNPYLLFHPVRNLN